jgi:branched-chain amino acid transport system ATP-binding protein
MSTEQTESWVAPAPRDQRPVLEVRDLAVHFGGVKAVDGISFSLQPGLVYGIIGPNGSGKTTTIGAVTRLTRITRGELRLDGRDLRKLRASSLARHGVARTFQTVRLLPDLTVAQNIELGADIAGGGVRRGVSAEVRAAVERTNLAGLEDLYPSELSYGTQRRVEIARAISMSPKLLLLDEPTAGMNQAERAEVSALIKDLRSEGLCQLLIEHDVQMMLDTCDELIAMNFGKLITQGAPDEVVRDRQVQEAYLGTRWGADAEGA